MNERMDTAKREWFFPDAYLPDISDGISHEAVCVLNLGEKEAHLLLTLYYEEDEALTGYEVICPGEKTRHIRLDKIRNREGKAVPQLLPYSIRLESDIPVYCQYTRVDATKPAYSLMTTMGL